MGKKCAIYVWSSLDCSQGLAGQDDGNAMFHLGRWYAGLVGATCQSGTVVREVICQKSGNEVVAMVVPGLHA